MPQIVITLADTPSGGVSLKTDFDPRVGSPLTPAQSTALEIIRRTRSEWKLPVPVLGEVDIDAVHRTRANGAAA